MTKEAVYLKMLELQKELDKIGVSECFTRNHQEPLSLLDLQAGLDYAILELESKKVNVLLGVEMHEKEVCNMLHSIKYLLSLMHTEKSALQNIK